MNFPLEVAYEDLRQAVLEYLDDLWLNDEMAKWPAELARLVNWETARRAK